MSRGTVAVGVLVLLAILALGLSFTGPVDRAHDETALPDSPTGDHLVSAIALHQSSDGTWWILEQSLTNESRGAVYQQTGNWDATDRRHGIVIPTNGSQSGASPSDISQRPDGGWYVLSNDNTVYIYDESWEYTGRNIELPRPDRSTHRSSDAFERTENGWWVDAYGKLTLYDHEFREIRASYDGYQELELGTEDSDTQYGEMTVGDVRTIHADGEEMYVTASVGDKFYRFEQTPTNLASTVPESTFTPRRNPPYIADIATEPSSRNYVLRRDGTIYEYTDGWIYTGRQRTVGSGYADDRYPADYINLLSFVPITQTIERLFTVLYLFVVLGIVRARGAESKTVYDAAMASGLVSYAVFFEPFPARPYLFVHPFLLPLGLLAVLAGVAYHAYTEREAAGALFWVYLPVLLGAGAIIYDLWTLPG